MNRTLKSRNFFIVNIALICLIIGFVIGISSFSCSTNKTNNKTAYAEDLQTGNAAVTSLAGLQNSFRSVAQKVMPSVVLIDVVDIVTQEVLSGGNSPFEFFFNPFGGNGDNNQESPQPREFNRGGLGSGVIVQRDGKKVYVLTNDHVVGEAEKITVTLYDERQFDAKIVGHDERKDLALIVFETNEEVAIAELGNSEDVFVGDWTLAVGNPMGLQSTVTAGIISALGREGGPNNASIVDYLQTDAAINPGNSGGALVNIYGQVIGINSWIASSTGSYTGYGFAIPINYAKKAIADFISFGHAEYGWLGVSIFDPYPELSKQMNIENKTGAFVSHVFKGSPAQKGGILPGDFIIQLNGVAIKGTRHLTNLIGDLTAQDLQEFVVIRLGEQKKLNIILAIRQEEKEIAANNKNLWPGLNPVILTPEIRARLKLADSIEGLVLMQVDNGTPGKIAGFIAGDVITEIGGQKIKTMLDFYKAINDTSKKELMIKYWRDGIELGIALIR